MDALKRAADHIRVLESRIRELEKLVSDKNQQLSTLLLEVPGGQRKLERLGFSTMATTTPTTKNEWPSDRVRSTFIQFFETRYQHVNWKSSPVIPPAEETTLMFANSGMNQFKPIFLGQVDPNSELAKLTRACNTQKCLRAGGKHNDLDDVGRDSYHHSFFEMLGNWSFGDYFKKQAIEMAWELLTKEYKIDPSRLYATYFQGNDSVPCDNEAKELWLQFLPPSHVIPFGEKENFWEMGPTGPCGPCTEIHYDRVGNRDASMLVNQDDPLCLEIWNLVFIQYNRNKDRSLTPLPQQHVDTGMGFERLCSVLQHKMSNYDIDLFMQLFKEIELRSNVGPYLGRYGEEDVKLTDTAYRVVCDHLRALCHAIADGCQPDRSDKGYVLRRILRRAVRHGKETLLAQDYFLSNLVDFYAESVKDVFPEVYEKRVLVKEVIFREEADFMKTIKQGREYFTSIVNKSKSKKISGDDAFFMYATHGFPLDLTEIMAHEMGMTVDTDRFYAKMKEEKLISQQDHESKMNSSSGESGVRIPKLDAFATDYLETQAQVQATTNLDDKLVFCPQTCSAKVVALFDPRSKTFLPHVDLEEGVVVGVVLDQTNFYHESGGQVSDQGTLVGPSFSFHVGDCQSSKGFVVHAGVGSGRISLNDQVQCKVDQDKRAKCAKNHTSTHLLNLALRTVLSVPVDQKGSLVDEDKLRFDFDYNQPISPQQLEAIETFVCNEIASDRTVYAQVIPLKQAKQIQTLRAVFGEIYPDPVRVISVGVPVDELLRDPTNPQFASTSVELCGGSHLERTSQAKLFCLLSDEGVAKGVRRIVALTGDKAQEAHECGVKLALQVSELNTNTTLDQIETIQRQVLASTVSKHVRVQLDQELVLAYKRASELEKVAEKKEVSLMCTTIFNKNTNAPVLVVECGMRTVRFVEALAKELLKQHEAVFLFCDQDATSFASCAMAKSSDLVQAHEWTQALMAKGLGKGGGKPGKANLRGDLANKKAAMECALQAITAKGIVAVSIAL